MITSIQPKTIYACRFWDKLKGITCVRNAQQTLILCGCSHIHTLFLKYAIDVAFVSKYGEVLKVVYQMHPNTFISCKGACMVIERISSQEPWIKEGETLSLS